MLVTSEEMEDDLVYRIVKAMFEHKEKQAWKGQ
ncbi:MAG: hypothetical protein AB1816_13025 [Bacillota bacterium]